LDLIKATQTCTAANMVLAKAGLDIGTSAAVNSQSSVLGLTV